MATDTQIRFVTDRRRFSPKARLLIGLALALTLSACQPKRQSERLTVASAGRISSLDPALASTTGVLQVLSALGDTLYRRDANGKLQPQLAASKPELSNDGLNLTIPCVETCCSMTALALTLTQWHSVSGAFYASALNAI